MEKNQNAGSCGGITVVGYPPPAGSHLRAIANIESRMIAIPNAGTPLIKSDIGSIILSNPLRI
jgi:hypothetical protein